MNACHSLAVVFDEASDILNIMNHHQFSGLLGANRQSSVQQKLHAGKSIFT